MKSLTNRCQQRLLKGWGDALLPHKQALITCKPVLREIFTIMTQELTNENLDHEEVGRRASVIADIANFIETLKTEDIVPQSTRPARPALSKQQ